MTQAVAANAKVLHHIFEAEPVLVDVAPAIEVVPNMTKETILTSGAPLPWEEYEGGQKKSIIGGAMFEGLAKDDSDFDRKAAQGLIKVRPCHDYGCIGSLTGVTTASMPVFVVENRAKGNRAFCTIFEGPNRENRLNYGIYNETVRQNLNFLNDVIARVIGEAVRIGGGIPLNPIMRRALNFGDELHSRNTAASVLFAYELIPHLLKAAEKTPELVQKTLDWLKQSESYFFLRQGNKQDPDCPFDSLGLSYKLLTTYSNTSVHVCSASSKIFFASLETDVIHTVNVEPDFVLSWVLA